MLPIKKGLFIHKHPTDVKVIIKDGVERYGCSWLAYCIQDVKINAEGKPYTQAMNRYNIFTDKWLRELVEQSERKLAIFPYANILCSDPLKESQDIIKRIAEHARKPAFGGIMLRLKPTVNREGYLIERLIRYIRAEYSGMTIGGVYDSPRHDEAVKALLANTDYHMPLIHGTVDRLYQEFHSAYVYASTYSKKPIYPIVSISDMPAVRYKVDTAKVKAFWNTEMSDLTMNAVGLWNWYPEDPGVVRITMDGKDAAKIRQLIEGMLWRLQVIPPAVVIPGDNGEPPVIAPIEPDIPPSHNEYSFTNERWIEVYKDYLSRKP